MTTQLDRFLDDFGQDTISLKEIVKTQRDALIVFENRRKLAHSLRNEAPQVAAFVDAVGVEIDKYLSRCEEIARKSLDS